MSNTRTLRRPIHADPDSLATRATEMDRAYLDAHPETEAYTREMIPGEFLATGKHVPAHWRVMVMRISGDASARIPHEPEIGRAA